MGLDNIWIEPAGKTLKPGMITSVACLAFHHSASPQSNLESRRPCMDVFSDNSILETICRRYRIRQLSLFGSTLKGTDRPDSDVDLLVEFEPEARPSLFTMVEIELALSPLVGGRKIDLRTAGDLSRHFVTRSFGARSHFMKPADGSIIDQLTPSSPSSGRAWWRNGSASHPRRPGSSRGTARTGFRWETRTPLKKGPKGAIPARGTLTYMFELASKLRPEFSFKGRRWNDRSSRARARHLRSSRRAASQITFSPKNALSSDLRSIGSVVPFRQL
jgi:predicted nucleotidyltransferase